MTPHKIGDRVVCPDPDGGTFIGTVEHIDGSGRVTVNHSPNRWYTVTPEKVRPVMPRDRHDVDRDRWWWRNGRPVWVTWTASGVVWSPSSGWPYGSPVTLADDWAGPVAPPPEVRS